MKLLIILLLVFPTLAFCQVEFDFKKTINVERIGQKQTEIGEDSTIFETRYLGKINMKEGSMHSKDVSYHVFSQFYSIQAAIARHGHSRMAFMDETGKIVRIYTLDMPDELPTSITKNNGLTFSTGTIQYLSLPDLFCIPDGGCYE